MTQPANRLISASGYDLTPPAPEERKGLEAVLTPEERRVLLHHGTESPFCGGLLHNKQEGVYVCRLCGLPLFRSVAKFESGTGWPSFYAPFDPDHIANLTDTSYGTIRTEIRCRRCDSHLGHVFDDGPAPTGRRYCLNSVSLRFVEKGEGAAIKADAAGS
jgi:peptide-methionine (R)-S-oxide reductase